MNIKVIGVTTDKDRIAEMLGVENVFEYGLYQETNMGKYYARFLADGTFDNKLVRLISHEAAAELEARAIANIANIIAKAEEEQQKNATPAINLERHKRTCEEISTSVKAKANEMGKNVRRIIENAGFNPSYSNN